MAAVLIVVSIVVPRVMVNRSWMHDRARLRHHARVSVTIR
jgi:hypothetical protein